MLSWFLRRHYEKKIIKEREDRDKSQQKIIELSELLEMHQKRLTSIIESQQEMVCRFTPETTLTFVNNAYCRTFNIQETDLLNKNFIDYVKDEDKELVKNSIRKLTPQNLTNLIQYRVLIDCEIRWQEWSNTVIINDKNEIIEYQSVGRDITDKKLLEYELKNQNKLLNSILESASTLIVRMDLKGNILYANQSYLNTFFKEDEEYIGVNFCDHHVHEEHRELIREIIQQAITPPKHRYEIDKKSITAKGEVRWYHAEVVGIKGDNGDSDKVIQIQSFIRDITKRKEYESEIQNLLDEYDTLLNNVDTLVWYVTDPETMGAVNQAYADFFGINKNEIIGTKLKDIIDINQLKECLYNNRRIFNEGITIKSEEYTINNSGEKRWLSITKRPKKNPDGTVEYIVASAIDITDKKIIEDQLKEKELFLKLLIQSIPVPVFYKDINGCYQLFNQSFVDMFKMSSEELIGKTVFEVNPKEYADIYYRHDNEILNKPITQIYQTKFENKLGEILDVILHKSSVTNISGEIIGIVGAIIDITERKRFEDQIKESEEKYRAIFDNSHVALFRTKIDNGELIEINQQYAKLTGYSNVDDCLKNFKVIDSYVDIKERNQLITDLKKYGSIADYETQIIRKDGSRFWISFSATIFSKQGYLEGSIVDINDRKISEEKYRLLAENSIDIIWTTDLDLKVTYISPSVLTLTGYTCKEYIKLSLDQRHTSETVKNIIDLFNNFISVPIDEQKETIIRIEGDSLRKDGSIFSTDIVCRGIFKDNELVGLQGITSDITIRKEYEKKLKQQRDLFDSVLDKQMDYVVRYNLNKEILYANKVYCDLLYGGNTCQGLTINTDLIHPDDKLIFEKYFNDLQSFPYMEESTFRILVDNDYRYFHALGTSILDDNDKVIEIQSVGRDITDYFNLEKLLKYKNQLLSGILETQSACIARANMDRKLVYANKAYSRIFCGSDSVESCYTIDDFMEQVHPDDYDFVNDCLNKLIKHSTSSQSIEYRIIDFDGKTRFFRWEASIILDGNKKPFEIQAVGYDMDSFNKNKRNL